MKPIQTVAIADRGFFLSVSNTCTYEAYSDNHQNNIDIKKQVSNTCTYEAYSDHNSQEFDSTWRVSNTCTYEAYSDIKTTKLNGLSLYQTHAHMKPIQT